MLAKKYAVVDQSRCVACGECTHVCPKEAISVPHGCFAAVNIEKCIGCGKCARACPAGCIKVNLIRQGI
ncbi:4Fe-4S binding protein [Acetivibrio mesophilus]|uniref:4Fe-4S dicluster domain-containing protein n=1 Tax=Acetivibrio mesophilus TaxID=2487273 RepID=A0A4Q0I1U2_9FIRM|nr:4Fe-4S binding protein [Acetivibrio mesophilus]ODM27749.1 4Fe-4S ferredoxin [Clostridium sp. Bc-iso-3]RXE58148.1 4Fe-4S dicluster domain-containing protein [Acetivibrio mesophilus]HHV30560.1 4Fe-4S binding protein [Clostridium sp.]